MPDAAWHWNPRSHPESAPVSSAAKSSPRDVHAGGEETENHHQQDPNQRDPQGSLSEYDPSREEGKADVQIDQRDDAPRHGKQEAALAGEVPPAKSVDEHAAHRQHAEDGQCFYDSHLELLDLCNVIRRMVRAGDFHQRPLHSPALRSRHRFPAVRAWRDYGKPSQPESRPVTLQTRAFPRGCVLIKALGDRLGCGGVTSLEARGQMRLWYPCIPGSRASSLGGFSPAGRPRRRERARRSSKSG